MVVVDAVATGVDVGVGGLEALVDLDAAPGGDRKARLPGQLGIGNCAHRSDDQVGRQDFLFGDYFEGMIVPSVGPDFLDGCLKVEGDAFIPEMLSDHTGQTGFQDAGEDLGSDLHQGGLEAPEVADGLGHLDADGAGADDDSAAHFAPGDLIPDGHGGGEAGDVHDPGEVGAGYGQGAGAAAGGQNQVVIREVFLLAGDQIKDPHLPVPSVDGQYPGADFYPDVFGGFKKFRGPEHVEAGAHQLLDIAQITRDIVGDAAPPIGDVFALIHHGDFEVGAEAFQAAGHLGTQGHGPDDDDAFRFHAVSFEWLNFGRSWCAVAQGAHTGAPLRG